VADKASVGVRQAFLRASVAAGIALGAAMWCAPVPAGAGSYTTGPACGEKIVDAPTGVKFRILFANNGSVQRYEVTALADNPEAVNDARLALEGTYGPAAVNAPALKIISFKPNDGGSGMMVPDKAIDSCGRTLSFN
jgi:hypothetical protein